jgi:hypothetical protein
MNELRGYGEGVGRIRAERCRQITAEGYTPEKDDLLVAGELAVAAACFAVAGDEEHVARVAVMDMETLEDGFPWEPLYDKRDEHDRLRQLEIAGALIAAEIDRLLRRRARGEG